MRERALSKITIIILLAALSAILYSASKILPFYYYYFELQNQFEQLIRVASTEDDEYIRKRIHEMIDFYEIPADKGRLNVIRQGRRMTIKLPYKEVFYVRFRGKDYDLKVFDFEAYATGEY